MYRAACLCADSRSLQRALECCTQYVTQAQSHDFLSKCYSDLARAIVDALEKSRTDKTIVGCYDFAQPAEGFINQQVQERAITVAANLANELRNKDLPAQTLQMRREQLVKLHTCFSNFYHNPFDAGALAALDAITLELQKTFDYTKDSKVHKSRSLLELYKLLNSLMVDWSVTTQMGTFSLDTLTKFRGTVEQNALNHEMIRHYDMLQSAKKGEFSAERMALLNANMQLIEQAHKLNQEGRVIVAKAVLTIARDFTDVIIHDRPFSEMAHYAAHIATHPVDYVVDTVQGAVTTAVKGFSFLSNALIEEVQYYWTMSPEECLASNKQFNESAQRFLEGWKDIPKSQKKELVAKILVDCAVGKGASALPGLLNKADVFSKVGSVFERVAGVLERSDFLPPNSGGAAALALSPEAVLADGLRSVGKAIGNLPPLPEIPGPVGTAIGVGQGVSDAVMFAHRDTVIASGNFVDCDIKPDTIKLENITNKPIDSITDPKEVIHKVPLSPNNTLIRKFDIIKNHYKHVFSKHHINDGIMQLGQDKTDIIEKLINIILPLDRDGILVIGDNQIETVLGGVDVTIRVHIQNNTVLSFDGFKGISNSVIGKLIRVDLI